MRPPDPSLDAAPLTACLQVGSPAPGFAMPCTPDPDSGRTRARLEDYRGRWLALIFYPRDFTLVCPTELVALGARIEDFRTLRCELLGVSTDSLEAHERWLATPRAEGGLGGLEFPLASDGDTRASRAYGVYLENQDVALRGLFLIDPAGILQYQVVHNLSVGRRADHVLRVLEALQSGGLCASDWAAGDPTIDPTNQIGRGSIVSHYTIEDRIGAGSFGAVFRARDRHLDRLVALKVLRPGAPRSALDEARAAAGLSHPYICTIYAVDDASGIPLIAMEYLHGRSLGQLLAEAGALPPGRAAMLAAQVAAGLAHAHAHGVVHGDLKPENVMVADDGPAKLLDFGLARRHATAVDPDATADYSAPRDHRAGRLFGTPSYMAPEQTRGEPPGPAADVFAFGILLTEMLTGMRLFAGPNVLAVLDQVRRIDPVAVAARVPGPFAPVIRSALEPDPSRRTLAMAEVARLLAPARCGPS